MTEIQQFTCYPTTEAGMDGKISQDAANWAMIAGHTAQINALEKTTVRIEDTVKETGNKVEQLAAETNRTVVSIRDEIASTGSKLLEDNKSSNDKMLTLISQNAQTLTGANTTLADRIRKVEDEQLVARTTVGNMRLLIVFIGAVATIGIAAIALYK